MIMHPAPRGLKPNFHSHQAAGLVRWWPMPLLAYGMGDTNTESNVRDYMRNLRMTSIENATWDIGPGGIGPSVYISGSMTSAASNNLGIYLATTTSDITIAGWAVTDFVNGTSEQVNATILGIGGLSRPIVRLCVTGTPAKARFTVSADGGSQTDVTGTTTIIQGQLTHFCGVLKNNGAAGGGDTAAIYVNGLLENSASSETMDNITTRFFRLGHDGITGPTNGIWKGWIGDVRVYDRALSDGEIFELWRPETRWDLYQEPLFDHPAGRTSSGSVYFSADAARLIQPQIMVICS